LFKSEIWFWCLCIVLSVNDLHQKQMSSTECLSWYIYILYFLCEISWVSSLFQCQQGQVSCQCSYQKFDFSLYMKQCSLNFLIDKLNTE
jgi:hypothetical protein